MEKKEVTAVEPTSRINQIHIIDWDELEDSDDDYETVPKSAGTGASTVPSEAKTEKVSKPDPSSEGEEFEEMPESGRGRRGVRYVRKGERSQGRRSRRTGGGRFVDPQPGKINLRDLIPSDPNDLKNSAPGISVGIINTVKDADRGYKGF